MLKTRTFAVGAMFTGVAGSLGAIAIQFVAPDAFSVFLSITFFVGMTVGGGASIVGAIAGGVFIVFVPNIADSISKAAPGAVYGLILILFMFLMPGGLAGLLRAAMRRMRAQAGQ
jgi:branched-chain amino acid transport system permease protein